MSKKNNGPKFPAFGNLPGVKLSAISAGIKAPDQLDFTLIELASGSTMAATFTQNKFCAAPVQLAQQHLSARTASTPSYWVVNTGYANAGTGQKGLDDAQKICEKVAEQMQVELSQVLPFSTGVIGEYLPIDQMLENIATLCACLDVPTVENALWHKIAKGIMTTDTCPKGVYFSGEWQGQTFHIGGITKGAGMIKPNMATMLAFIVTDLAISKNILQEMLQTAVEGSFNSISVDGDTSTNDACVLAATAKSSVEPIEGGNPALLSKVQEALNQVCLSLALEIVKDGEGATKCVEIAVKGARSVEDARTIAESVAHSPLVKTAFFAEDPNWGRILAAVGYADIKDLNIHQVDLYFNEMLILQNGVVSGTYQEKEAAAIMKQPEFRVVIDLNDGDSTQSIWTADFSYDYVKINAEYRS